MCVIDIFSKHNWMDTLKDKRGITFTDAFQKMLNESGQKLNEIWVAKSSEFYNEVLKSWLQSNNIEMYLTRNEGKSVVAEKFI